MECFYEQFQTREYGPIESKLKNASIIILILAFISLITLFFEFTILFLVVFVGLIILKRKLIIEYEYELTCDELSVYRITGKSKRKEMISFNIRNIVRIEKTNENNLKHKNIMNLSLDCIDIEQKIVRVNTNKGSVVLKLAMDDTLIGYIKRVNSLAFY